MSLSASKRASVAIIAIAQLMAMALWFSPSAVVPQLVAEFRVTGFMQSAARRLKTATVESAHYAIKEHHLNEEGTYIK